MPEVTCPKCSKTFNIEVPPGTLAAAASNPLKAAAIRVPHGDHELIVFVDTEGRVVRTEWSSQVSESVINRVIEVPVPSASAPEPRGLSGLEWMLLAMCDGRRSLEEICSSLGIPLGQGRLIVEKLKARGLIEKVIVKPGV